MFQCSNTEVASVVMDVFNYLDTETALSDNVGPEREYFSNFVKESQKVIYYYLILNYYK